MDLLAQLADQGYLRTTEQTNRRLRTLRDKGRITRLLPGTYVDPEKADRPEIQAAAIAAYDPGAVFTGASAAALHINRGRWPQVLTFHTPRQWRVSKPWAAPTRGVLPPEAVLQFPVRHVRPAVSLLQLPSVRVGTLQAALRGRTVKPRQLAEAVDFLAGQPGNRLRRELVDTVLSNSWSIPELQLHRLLKAHRFAGWTANLRVPCGRANYYLDIAFAEAMLAVEVDSWEFHSSAESFQEDRSRHNDLAAAGWTLLHVTPEQIDDRSGQVIRWIRDSLKQRSDPSTVGPNPLRIA